MGEVRSFHFSADGARAAAEDPEAFGLGLLASLYNEFREGDRLLGALVRMREFNNPGLLQNPRGFILKGGEDGVEILTPYNHYRDGPRCVLANAEAHMEWKKRADGAYKTRDKLPSDEELISYARSGHIPRGLAAFALAPSPPTVVFDFSMDTKPGPAVDIMLRNMYEAHRQHKVEIKGVFVNSKKGLKMPGKPRGGMPLCKDFADDKGGARGYVEDALRTRFMIEDNTFPLNRCSFEVRKKAYVANRKRILEYKSRERGCAVQDTRENWTTKVRWACDYQNACRGISLTPTKTTKTKKRKRDKQEPHPPRIQYNMSRGGAAKVSLEKLQIPQIVWGDSPSGYYENETRFDVLVISASRFVLLNEEYITEWSAPPILYRPRKIIVVGDLNPTTLVMRSWLALCNARVVSKDVDIENLHLLLQWLPLWWDHPKHVVPQKALLPNLRSKLDDFLLTAPPRPATGEDGPDEDTRPLWVRQLINGAKHLPLFAAACNIEDCKPVQISI